MKKAKSAALAYRMAYVGSKKELGREIFEAYGSKAGRVRRGFCVAAGAMSIRHKLGHKKVAYVKVWL